MPKKGSPAKRKKGSPAKRSTKAMTKAKAKLPAEDEIQVTATVQVHAPPAGAVSPDPDPQADAGPVAPGENEVARDGATPAVSSAVTLAAATDTPMELGEVNSPAFEEGEILLVEAAQDKEKEPVLVGKGRGLGQGKGKGKGKGKEKAIPKAAKKDWSLDAAVEEDILEWLKGNSYLWMRSKKGYKQKRVAWEMKAQELGIDVNHLEQWWKGIKDWYVKLSKKTSGQATKMLTERETWVLQHCGFYKGSIPSDTGDPLVTLVRVPSASASANAAAMVSRPPSPSGDRQSHVLDDMESAAVDQVPTCHPMSMSSRSRKRDKRRMEEEWQEEEDTWMRDLRATMQANQALLEKLVDERPQSDREPFVRFVADTLRTAPQEQYDGMKELIFDIVRQGWRAQPLNQQFSEPYSSQQYFRHHNPHNW